MDSGKCAPCKQLCKNVQGVYWCISCPELLCNPCSKYHKALSATEGHVVVSVEKYESLLPILKIIQVKCTEHPENTFEYFCAKHECPCCILCKRNQHNECPDVEKIEEVVKTVNVSDEFVKLNSKIGNDVRILEKLSKNCDQNILKLNEQREHLYEKLKTNREKINRALDAFEVETKCKLVCNFDKESEVIKKQQNRLLSKISDLKNGQHQIESILDVEVKSNIYFFLFQNKAMEQMKQNEADIDNMLASLLDISSACVLSTEVDHESQTVKMLQTLEFERRICSNDIGLEHESEDENETTASSTVEADDILKTGDLNPNDRDATALPCVKLFRYKHNFTLDPPDFNTENSNRIIKVVSHNRIMITGKYNKTLLFFSKLGGKQGEITIDYPTTAVTVINDDILAVAAHRAVVLVDTQIFKYINLIKLGDNCVGITYVKNQLVVNCETRGVIMMDVYGNITQILKSFTGRMQLCTVSDDTIALVYPHSNTIDFLNIKTSKKSSYIQILGRHGTTCVTSDQCGNMFITCQDEIFIARPAGNEYHSILSTTDEIKNPFSIDIDIKSHELFVLNNGGKSVYVFQKHMEDV
jgi:Holliday junction resolvase RusA-like endonuclease